MPLVEPTTVQLYEQFLANLESRLGQSAPISDKAYLRVESVAEAIIAKTLYKFAIERSLQTLALTATGDDLDTIGREYGVTRKPAEATTITVDFTGTATTLIPATTEWISDATSEPYTLDTDLTIGGGGTVSGDLTSTNTGENTNLANGATLTISSPLAGVDNTGTVSATVNAGLDRETDAAYRRRILTAIRTVGGGGNVADYREWSEEVADVSRAFPYSGKPLVFNFTGTDISFANADSSINSTSTDFVDEGITPGDHVTVSGSPSNTGTFHVVTVTTNKITVDTAITTEASGASITIVNESLPGDRTVFIESRLGDGVPTAQLLQDVRDNINTDPVTGIARPALGDTDEQLYVEPIVKTDIYVQISNMTAGTEPIGTTQSKIDTALADYFAAAQPFIIGLDFEPDRTDVITDPSISLVVQDVLQSVGATADTIGFALSGGGPFTLTTYTLGQGELPVLGGGGAIYV
jgi:uncharacterized phage protein gp47/JayE